MNIIRYLVENKADIKAKDRNEWTALHLSSRYGNLKY